MKSVSHPHVDLLRQEGFLVAGGIPILFFHGAEAKRSVFVPSEGRRFTFGRDYRVKASASFFTPDRDFALTFGPEVTEVHLRIHRPLDLSQGAWGVDSEQALSILRVHFGENVGFYPPEELWEILDQPDRVREIREAGYDGVKLVERGRHGVAYDTYAVFESQQVILAQDLDTFVRAALAKNLSAPKIIDHSYKQR